MYSNQTQKQNRSFSRRIGKTLSNIQKELLQSHLPTFLINKESISCIHEQDKEIFLEIGFGMGEHFIHQAKNKKEALFIGVEVYLNGVANVLKLATNDDITNILLWPDDLDMILEDFPNKSLSGIYILFPDPWPKRNQNKKRIFNQYRLEILQHKLKTNGFLMFASDIDDYFVVAKNLIKNNGHFKIIEDHHNLELEELDQLNNYLPTKYHNKAEENGRIAQFLTSRLIA